MAAPTSRCECTPSRSLVADDVSIRRNTAGSSNSRARNALLRAYESDRSGSRKSDRRSRKSMSGTVSPRTPVTSCGQWEGGGPEDGDGSFLVVEGKDRLCLLDFRTQSLSRAPRSSLPS